ncbi:MAG TPA: GTPase HflX [Cerasibacillus sp.]|uniref:GTPase HflX n=1 Tax=Cerasibacillus sp. TaxID=2498711 RepID=UPI002F3EC9BD
MAKEKVIIIAVKQQEHETEQFNSSLEELVSLTDTAGGVVKQIMTQNRTHIHPAYYIGTGKIQEIKREIEAHEIDLVISNDELSPGQLRNLEGHFNIRVIDRSQLILDIFASRAKTKEGKLQVELAQLEYNLPRLRGRGIELSRLGGGIGTRGPGETKLETDQRYIRQRIHDIKKRLKLADKQRDLYRHRRKRNDVFQIAIVGYTNAGKSTLFNQLTNSASLEEDKLFATLDPLTRQITLPSGLHALVTDTVGFIQDLPTTLIAAFQSTLEEVTEADFILHVIDGSHPNMEQHQDTVNHHIKQLGAEHIPMLTVYNKKDKFKEDLIPMAQPAIIISAYESDDFERLLLKIETVLKQIWEPFTIRLEPDRGSILFQLLNETIIEEKYFNEQNNQYVISGYMRENSPLNRLKGDIEE